MQRITEFIRLILQLSKVKITIAVAFTTITGYVLGKGYFDLGWIPVTIGIFFMACGSSVLNHLQEHKTDALMIRTRKRPIPGKKISIKGAVFIAVVEIAFGTLILWNISLTTLLLGWAALLWYNLVYTNLKRITAHAVIPGSVIGAIPPLAGWAAANVSLMDSRAVILAIFFFVWQVPHFYLLVLRYGNQYTKAGIPVVTAWHGEFQVRIIILLWIGATSAAAIMLSIFNVIQSEIARFGITLVSLWLFVVFLLPVLKKKHSYQTFTYFKRINYYVLFCIIFMNIDHLLVQWLT